MAGRSLPRKKSDKLPFETMAARTENIETEYAKNCRKDIPYYIVETKAADGYILDDTPHEVLLQYDDSAMETAVYTLKLKNKPSKPRLPQTGGDYHPWMIALAGGVLAGTGVYLYRRKRRTGR